MWLIIVIYAGLIILLVGMTYKFMFRLKPRSLEFTKQYSLAHGEIDEAFLISTGRNGRLTRLMAMF
jgi:hypothetical protein